VATLDNRTAKTDAFRKEVELDAITTNDRASPRTKAILLVEPIRRRIAIAFVRPTEAAIFTDIGRPILLTAEKVPVSEIKRSRLIRLWIVTPIAAGKAFDMVIAFRREGWADMAITAE
jgi:hypothetical protein